LRRFFTMIDRKYRGYLLVAAGVGNVVDTTIKPPPDAAFE
jgi:hypothetical protein